MPDQQEKCPTTWEGFFIAGVRCKKVIVGRFKRSSHIDHPCLPTPLTSNICLEPFGNYSYAFSTQWSKMNAVFPVNQLISVRNGVLFRTAQLYIFSLEFKLIWNTTNNVADHLELNYLLLWVTPDIKKKEQGIFKYA